MQENSITISEEQRDAFRLDAELKQHAGTVVGEMIEVGRCLKEISERKLYLLLDTGTFAEYAEKAVGLKERAAYNYIAAYETYGADGLKKYGSIGITKLVALTQLNDTDRSEMLESGKAAELSSRALQEEIKRLKGENDQLRFDADDAETSAKNNAAKLAEVRKELDERRAETEELRKQLEDASRPVVADMTDEEKDEIRREAEKKAAMDAAGEIKKLKSDHKTEVKTLRESLETAEKADKEKEGKIKDLTERLKTAEKEKAELQANAEKKKPVLTGSEETLKYYLEDIQHDFTRAAEIVSKMETEKKEKFKAALVVVSEKLKAAAEGI